MDSVITRRPDGAAKPPVSAVNTAGGFLMPSKRVPKYRLHKASGQAVVTLPAANGLRRRDVFLGQYGTPQSREEYARTLAEWNVAGGIAARVGDSLTIVELCVAYLEHCQRYYRKDDKPTSEVASIISALRCMQRLYGRAPAAEFGPLKLKAVREAMIAAGLARTTVNSHCSRIKRAFKWGVENELLPGSVHHGLAAVGGLRAGRSEARETAPVLPVADANIEAIRPHLSPLLWAMVQLQLLTGMRPGEVVQMRPIDIDMGGGVWLYRPASHKTAHHGKARVVAIGPRAQAVLRPLLPRDLHAHVFSPAAEAAAVLVNGDTSRRGLRMEDRQRPPGDRYNTGAYQHAVARACRRAGIEPWSPNQLRHTFATQVRRSDGLEAAQVALGHARLTTTQVYAERDVGKAIAVALRCG
jgi:integrase